MYLVIKLSPYMFRPMMAIIGRLNFITKNIVALDNLILILLICYKVQRSVKLL
jgi:hypothetical protein